MVYRISPSRPKNGCTGCAVWYALYASVRPRTDMYILCTPLYTPVRLHTEVYTLCTPQDRCVHPLYKSVQPYVHHVHQIYSCSDDFTPSLQLVHMCKPPVQFIPWLFTLCALCTPPLQLFCTFPRDLPKDYVEGRV